MYSIKNTNFRRTFLMGKEAKIFRESPGKRKLSERISVHFREKLYRIYRDFRQKRAC
jgi:hypothetical protein